MKIPYSKALAGLCLVLALAALVTAGVVEPFRVPAFGLALAQLGESYPDVVAVDGDVGNSTRTEVFGKKFPTRFFNVGRCISTTFHTASRSTRW